MSTDKIFALIFSLVGIVFTYWYFLGKKEKEVVVTDSIDIKVDGGYKPALITIKKGQTIKLNFVRTDQNSCLEEVNLPDFKVKKYLPLNKKVEVEINPDNTGTYTYSCGMNMYHGKIKVI